MGNLIEVAKKFFGKAHVVIFLVLFGLVGYGLYQNIQESTRQHRLSTHSHEVMTQITSTQARLYDADTIFMRYSIFKDERYLELYQHNSTDIEASIAKLKSSTEDNAVQQQNCDLLAVDFKRRLEYRKSVSHTDLKTIQQAAVSAESNNLHSTISGRFKLMMDEERQLLEKREEAFIFSVGVLILLLSMGGVMLAAAFGYISGEVAASRRVLSDFISGIK